MCSSSKEDSSHTLIVKSSEPDTNNLFCAAADVPWVDDEREVAEANTGEHKRQFTRAACALLNLGKGSVGKVQVEICPFSIHS